mgnify:CR=1 FL=1
MSEETDKINEILQANKDLDFVKRIEQIKGKAADDPSIPSIDLGKGYTGTHLMAADWDDEEERWLVYPTIVNIDGELTQMEANEAMLHAKSTGEFIDFSGDKDAAIAFSKNYKKVWDEE